MPEKEVTQEMSASRGFRRIFRRIEYFFNPPSMEEYMEQQSLADKERQKQELHLLNKAVLDDVVRH